MLYIYCSYVCICLEIFSRQKGVFESRRLNFDHALPHCPGGKRRDVGKLKVEVAMIVEHEFGLIAITEKDLKIIFFKVFQYLLSWTSEQSKNVKNSDSALCHSQQIAILYVVRLQQAVRAN